MVYHTSEDCQALNHYGAAHLRHRGEAIAANRTRLCAFCAKRDANYRVVTDDADALRPGGNGGNRGGPRRNRPNHKPPAIRREVFLFPILL